MNQAEPKDPQEPVEGAAIAGDEPAAVPGAPAPLPPTAVMNAPPPAVSAPRAAPPSGFEVPHQYPSKAEGLPPIPQTPTQHVVPRATPTPAVSPAAALAQGHEDREDLVEASHALREAAVAAAKKVQGG
jgi:hypothetical protein